MENIMITYIKDDKVKYINENSSLKAIIEADGWKVKKTPKKKEVKKEGK